MVVVAVVAAAVGVVAVYGESADVIIFMLRDNRD